MEGTPLASEAMAALVARAETLLVASGRVATGAREVMQATVLAGMEEIQEPGILPGSRDNTATRSSSFATVHECHDSK